MSDYNDLLTLLKKHVDFFNEMTVVQQEKLDATRIHDISALEECLKKEQAGTLMLRGLDKKRLALQEELSFQDMPMRQIITLLPEECQYEFTQVFKSLETAYSRYKKAGEAAKEAIELNLHQVNKTLDSLKAKTKTASGEVYSQEGSVSTDTLTFKDIKI